MSGRDRGILPVVGYLLGCRRNHPVPVHSIYTAVDRSVSISCNCTGSFTLLRNFRSPSYRQRVTNNVTRPECPVLPVCSKMYAIIRPLSGTIVFPKHRFNRTRSSTYVENLTIDNTEFLMLENDLSLENCF